MPLTLCDNPALSDGRLRCWPLDHPTRSDGPDAAPRGNPQTTREMTTMKAFLPTGRARRARRARRRPRADTATTLTDLREHRIRGEAVLTLS